MTRYILFSKPSPEVIEKIAPLLFPQEFKEKNLAYMPADGAAKEINEKYATTWKELAAKYNVKTFATIDNSSSDNIEKEKLSKSNTLIITGGNTFTLLNNIRRNGLDKEILALSKRNDSVIAGFSAGAAILTPTITIVTNEWNYGKDENKVNLNDLSGLNLVNFEVLPHYTDSDEQALKNYQQKSGYEVKPIRDSEYIVIENN